MARGEKACHRVAVTAPPAQAGAGRATHSRKRKWSRTSGRGTRRESKGFPRHGDSMSPQARRSHTIPVNEQARTEVHPLFRPGRGPGQSMAALLGGGRWAGRRGRCPSLRPEQGLDPSLLCSLPVPLQLRMCPSPLTPGASHSGFLVGSFPRTTFPHQEGSRSEIPRKT